MDFGYYDVPPELAPAVKLIWYARGTKAEFDAPEPIVPDGCVEIVFNLADPFVHVNGGGVTQPRDLLVGQGTQPTVAAPTGRVDLIGVRLRPARAGALLRIPMWELRDRLIAVSEVLPRGRRLVDDLRAVPEPERVPRLVRALAPICARVRPHRLHTVDRAIEQIEASRGAISIQQVAGQCGVTRRQLERKFREEVGAGAKHIARIARVQHALELLQPRGSSLSGADIAALCGYSDQAHMIHEFRALTGTTPTRLATTARSLSGLMRETT